MNKDEALTRLSEMGYNAVLESGVIMITVADEKAVKKANKAVKDIGYNASYGIKIGNVIDNQKN